MVCILEKNRKCLGLAARGRRDKQLGKTTGEPTMLPLVGRTFLGSVKLRGRTPQQAKEQRALTSTCPTKVWAESIISICLRNTP